MHRPYLLPRASHCHTPPSSNGLSAAEAQCLGLRRALVPDAVGNAEGGTCQANALARVQLREHEVERNLTVRIAFGALISNAFHLVGHSENVA